MPGPLSDCYVLALDRTAETARRFLDTFVPDRAFAAAAEDPVEVLGLPPGTSLDGVCSYLERFADREYSMYFRNRSDGEPYYAILAYCGDGSLVLGLSGDDDESSALHLLERLRPFTSLPGFWSIEEPPPGGRNEFLRRIGKS